MSAKDKLLVALDLPSFRDQSPEAVTAELMATKLEGEVGGFKVGKRLFVTHGPAVVRSIGPKRTFLDLKFHDIPNTVAQAVEAAAHHGVWMCNVHCLGGPQMMRAARDAANVSFTKTGYRPLLIGVTILTSHDRQSLDALGIRPGTSIETIVSDLAAMAAENGLDGVVCSPRETPVVRKRICDDGFIVITPGIRKSTDKPDDQKRTATAAEAISMGASYIVVGRPIIEAADPVAAARAIVADMETAVPAWAGEEP